MQPLHQQAELQQKGFKELPAPLGQQSFEGQEGAGLGFIKACHRLGQAFFNGVKHREALAVGQHDLKRFGWG